MCYPPSLHPQACYGLALLLGAFAAVNGAVAHADLQGLVGEHHKLSAAEAVETFGTVCKENQNCI